MRVMLWSSVFWPQIGGVEVLGAHLVRALRDRGHAVMVVARQDGLDSPAESELDGIRVARRPLFQPLASKDLDAIIRARRAVSELKREFCPDIVHVFLLGPELLFHRWTAAEHPAAEVVTLHQPFIDEYRRPHSPCALTISSADWITSCSKATLDRFRQALPAIDACSSVIPNRLPPPKLDARPASAAIPYLLCLGRLDRQKGFDLAVAAMPAVVAAHPEVRLVIAGDGPCRAELARQANVLGIDDAVELTGWIAPEEVARLVGRATIVLVPSRWEPFGLVALQAAQLGRPVVAAAVEGLTEVVVDDLTGVLVEPDDVEALATTVIGLLESPARARALGERAMQRAAAGPGWERFVDEYEAVYERAAVR